MTPSSFAGDPGSADDGGATTGIGAAPVFGGEGGDGGVGGVRSRKPDGGLNVDGGTTGELGDDTTLIGVSGVLTRLDCGCWKVAGLEFTGGAEIELVCAVDGIP